MPKFKNGKEPKKVIEIERDISDEYDPERQAMTFGVPLDATVKARLIKGADVYEVTISSDVEGLISD